MPSASPERRELAHRRSDGIDVTLFWYGATNRVVIAVHDTRSDEALEFDINGSVAIDAFNHPYAYAAGLRVESVRPPSVAGDPLTDERALS
jgi:hypothetical protein